jgi:transcriptional antiterminator NusG
MRFHPMEDERERTTEDALDEAPASIADLAASDRPAPEQASDALVDDAETNRSDDTALEEARDAAEGNGAAGGQGVAGEEEEEVSQPGEAAASGENIATVKDAAKAPAKRSAPRRPAKAAAAPAKKPPIDEDIHMDWYILKVQSNRERSIAEALQRKMRIEGLDRYFDQVIVPTEKVTEFKGGKKKIVERKLYPGYIVVHMHINDDTWFAVRETSGVGDFTGAGGKPTPMLAHEVARIVQTEEEETSETPKLDIKFAAGDKVKVKEGNFENFEGEVSTIDEASGRVVVMINIFGRSTPVELEYWQIETV